MWSEEGACDSQSEGIRRRRLSLGLLRSMKKMFCGFIFHVSDEAQGFLLLFKDPATPLGNRLSRYCRRAFNFPSVCLSLSRNIDQVERSASRHFLTLVLKILLPHTMLRSRRSRSGSRRSDWSYHLARFRDYHGTDQESTLY